ncbi:unnamed protein product [Moneuplotes crassus]|uniref:Cyclic nucleotide-binding domain-containing protein n=1 Tax=Euplotes crassus TaxID=5936 RepID=A0AAD1U428_EUPCR|nr:unnamed protein product [Moneuplotes crassus]
MVNTSFREHHRKSITRENANKSCYEHKTPLKAARVKFIQAKKGMQNEKVTDFTTHDSPKGKKTSSASFYRKTTRSTARRSTNYDLSTGRRLHLTSNNTNRSYSKAYQNEMKRTSSVFHSRRDYLSTKKPDNINQNEITHPRQFSQVINNFFNEIELYDYQNFKFKKDKSKRDKLKEFLSKYYSPSQIIGLLSIYKERLIHKGTIIKEKGLNFTFADTSSKAIKGSTSSQADSDSNLAMQEEKSEVFVIKSGIMGLYVYSYGEKKLMTTFSTKEVVGEWNFNFLHSKAAQYEALTDMEIIYFDKVDYEKVMCESKTKKYQSNFEFFKKFRKFRSLNEHGMKKLCAIAKEKKFTCSNNFGRNKDEFVTLNGCKADCLYIVVKGTFRAERYVTIEHENLWPVESKVWKSTKIRRRVLFTSNILKPNTIFGERELVSSSEHSLSIVANSNDAVLLFIEKDKLDAILNIETLVSEVSVKFPTEKEIIQKMQVIEKSLHMQKISFLNSTNTNFLPSSFRDFYMDKETIKLYPWVRNIENKYKHKLAQKVSQKPEDETKSMKFPVVGVEEKYLNLKKYIKAQRIKERSMDQIADDIIIELCTN